MTDDAVLLDQKYRQKLVEVVQSSLEEIGFMEILEAPDFSNYDEDIERYRAAILINDPLPGEIRLIMPKNLVQAIGENVYAMEEEELSEELYNDILGEMINVVAGNLMRLWIPGEEGFAMGLPSVGQGTYLKIHTNTNAIEFDMEGTPFWLILLGEMFSKPPANIEEN